MAEIKNEIQYQKLLERIEELHQVVGNETSPEDKNFVELDLLSDLLAEYEEKFHSRIHFQKRNVDNQEIDRG